MTMNQWQNHKIIKRWIEYVADGRDPKGDPNGNDIWCELGDMASRDSARAWKIIMALIDRNDVMELDLIGDIAAGPFEDLLHGISGSLEEFFPAGELPYVDRLIPHIIYSLLEPQKKSWLDQRKALLNKRDG